MNKLVLAPISFCLILLSLASCSSPSSRVSLEYIPNPAQSIRGKPEFIEGVFVNRRPEGPNFLGTVRMQLGVPVENIQTQTPVGEIVSNAFAYALDTRGMLTSRKAARYIVTGDVLQLYCQQIVHPYAFAKLQVNIVEARTGRIVHSGVYMGERQSAAYRPGSGSPVPLLRDLTSRALQDAVDAALDDRAMRNRLGQASPNPRYVPGMF
jgi:hypothetical protein